MPWQPEPLTLGSLFSAHKSVRGRVPKPSWCPQHPRLPFKAFQGGGSGGRCHCADVRPQRPRLAGTSGFGRGAPSLAPCATALTQQRSGSVHVHLPPRCAPLRRADTPGGTPLNSPPPTAAPPAFKRIFPGPPRLSGWGPRRHFHQVPPVTFKCENTCHWAGTSMG